MIYKQKNIFFERVNRISSVFLKRVSCFIKSLNENSVFAIWMAVIVLVCALLWGLTAGLRSNITINVVNKILSGEGEERQIEHAISMWHIPGNIAQLGMWFTMTSHENAVIFPFIIDGIFSPCLAIIDNDGKIGKLIPLTVNADRVISRTSPGYLRILVDRIEENAGILKRILDEKYRLKENV
jgi:hypothetical protein